MGKGLGNETKSAILKWMMKLLAVVFIITSCYDFFSVAQSNEDAVKRDSMPNSLRQLLTAQSFDDGIQGESPTRSQNFLAYLDASDKISSLEVSDLNYVLEHGTPAGKLYAAVLLKQSSKVGDNLSFDKLLNDHSKVDYKSGCRGLQTDVAEIAKSLKEKSSYHNFQFSMFCKMKAPIKEEPKK